MKSDSAYVDTLVDNLRVFPDGVVFRRDLGVAERLCWLRRRSCPFDSSGICEKDADNSGTSDKYYMELHPWRARDISYRHQRLVI